MNTTPKIFRLKAASLNLASAKAIAERVVPQVDADVVVELKELTSIAPEAAALLARLIGERKAAGKETRFDAPAPILEAIAMAEKGASQPQPKPQPQPHAAAPTQSAMPAQGAAQPQAAPPARAAAAHSREERREGIGALPHARSIAVPRMPEQAASMTDFGTIVAAVLTRKLLLAVIATAAIGLGVAAGMMLGKSTYEAEAVLLYKPTGNELSDEYEVLQNLDEATTFIYRQGSRKEQTTAANVQIKTLLNTVEIPSNLEAVRAKLGLKVPLNTLGAGIEVRVQKETELMIVKTTWSDARNAADITNTLVDVFIEANKRINKENVVGMRDRLAAQLETVSAEYAKMSGELAAFSQQNRIVDLKKESEQYVQELIRLKSQRDEAVSTREGIKIQLADLDKNLADLKKAIAAEKAEAGKKPTAAEVDAKIAAIQMKLDRDKAKKVAMADLVAKQADYDRLKQLYAEGLASKSELDKALAAKDKALVDSQDDPETANLLKEIEALRATTSKMTATSTATERLAEELSLKRFEAQLQLVSVEASIGAYDASAKRVQGSIDTLPAVNKEYARLTTENAGLEAEKKGLERMLAQANTLLDKGGSDFSVISPAPTPIYASSSNKKLLAIGGFIAVLIVGWGSILLIELLDSRIRSGKEATAALGIKVLASLQKSDKRRLLPNGKEDPALIEEYRILALKLRRLLSRKGERILIASVAPEAGKSVLAANLALAWGRTHEKVLVIDAETRKNVKPWPLETLAAEARKSAPGICEYLTHAVKSLDDTVRPSMLPGVDIVGSGKAEALPDLLGTPHFVKLLVEASSSYGVVLIEAPAALKRADAALIGGYCNGIILVVRSRTVTPAAITRTIEELGRERILGVVMTDVAKVFAKRDA